jgi:hypothetical protein
LRLNCFIAINKKHISSYSSSPLQLLVQKGIVPMRLQELLLVAQQPQEQQPFFTVGFSFRSGLKKSASETNLNADFTVFCHFDGGEIT